MFGLLILVCPLSIQQSTDSASGGYIDLDFREETYVDYITLMDTDEVTKTVITVYYASGSTEKITTSGTGNNGAFAEPIMKSNVVKIRVDFPGSGAISDIKYTFCPPPGNCPVSAIPLHNFNRGDFLYEQLWSSHGVKVVAKKTAGFSQGYTPINGVHNDAGGAAMVFDTSNPLCPSSSANDGDADLGSPNSECPGGGPGKDFGDHWGGGPTSGSDPNPFQNCEALGNVLVIQESSDWCPDDSSRGGYIQFQFRSPAYVHSLKLLDVDNNESPPKIKVRYSNGTERFWFAGKTGNNGVWTESLLQGDVSWILINFYGSGSVTDVQYSECIGYY